MKKLINKIGIITFSVSPIFAIASTPSSFPTSASPQFKLVQSFQTKLSKSFKNSKWASQTQINSGSNIANGAHGTIFEDSRGNLWSMGYKIPLQKYDYTTSRWTTETKENSGSNISNGRDGTIFEDSRGNLWSMGTGRSLQKLAPTKETSLDGLKVKDFDIEFKTRINSDSKIAILIKGYRKYTSSLFTHL